MLAQCRLPFSRCLAVPCFGRSFNLVGGDWLQFPSRKRRNVWDVTCQMMVTTGRTLFLFSI